MSGLLLQRVWVVECSRCANEGTSYEMTEGDASDDLWAQGWTDDGMCPACNGGVA